MFKVTDKKVKWMLDTGARHTFISLTVWHLLKDKKVVNDSYKRSVLADGYTSLSILGTLNLSIIMGNMLTSINLSAVKELCVDCTRTCKYMILVCWPPCTQGDRPLRIVCFLSYFITFFNFSILFSMFLFSFSSLFSSYFVYLLLISLRLLVVYIVHAIHLVRASFLLVFDY